jgi:hypothetical protein
VAAASSCMTTPGRCAGSRRWGSAEARDDEERSGALESDPIMATTLERIAAAIPVGSAFWQALAADDDEALGPLLSSTWDGRPPGFAKLYRDDRSLSVEACGLLGLATQVDLLEGDRIRMWYSITDRPIHFDEATPLTAWRLELVEVDGHWLVDRTSDIESIGYIDISPLFPEDTLRAVHDAPPEPLH